MKTIKQLGSFALSLLLAIIAIIGAVIIALNSLNSSLQTTSTNLSSEVASVSADLTADPVISASGAGAGAGEVAVTLCNYKATISSDLIYADGFVNDHITNYSGSGNCTDSELAAAFSDSAKGTAIVVFPENIEGYDCKNDFSGYHTITAIVDVIDYGLYNDNDFGISSDLSDPEYHYYPLNSSVENVDATSLTSTSNANLLELHTTFSFDSRSDALQLSNGALLLETGVPGDSEFYNEATCFVSWKDVGNEAITGITDDHKQMVLTNIENKVTTLNDELTTMTSSITTVDATGDSGGGVHPYGQNILEYDYSAITSAITNINALFAVVDGKASADYFTYKVYYAIEANSYGITLDTDSLIYIENNAAAQLSTAVDTTLVFLEGDPLAAFNDQECQLTIDVNVDIETTHDLQTGTTTTYSHQNTVLSNNEGNCPENILAVALDKIEETVEGRTTITNVNVMTLPYTVGGDTFNSCGEFFNREGVAPTHFIEININVSTNNEAINDFPQHTMNIYFAHEALTQNINGDWVYNTFNDKFVPPNGNVSLAITISKSSTEHYFFISGVHNELLVTSSSRACYYWDNTPFE